MSLLSRKPKPQPDYVTEGHQPGAGHPRPGHALCPDKRIAEAQERHEHGQAADTSWHPAAMVPTVIPTAVVTASSGAWEPYSVALPYGQVVEILPRQVDREKCKIVNQSSAVTTKAATVYLFGTETDARAFSNAPAAVQQQMLERGLKTYIVPDTDDQSFTHNAPVFAVAPDPGTGGAVAVVSVSIERSKIAQ